MADRAQAGGDLFRAFELDAMPLAVIERERVAIESIAARERQACGGIQAAAQQADSFHLGSFSASRNPASGMITSPPKAICMEKWSETQPVSGMKIMPANPHAAPIINAETVPARAGTSAWPIITF